MSAITFVAYMACMCANFNSGVLILCMWYSISAVPHMYDCVWHARVLILHGSSMHDGMRAGTCSVHAAVACLMA